MNDAISANRIAEGATQQLSSILIRVGELSEQSASGTLSNVQRSALDQEAQSLRSEFNRIVGTTNFNGLALLDGSMPSISIQTGYDSLTLSLGDLGTSTSGDGTFLAQTAQVLLGEIGATGDVNGDGTLDFVSVNGPTDTLYVYLGNGDGSLKVGSNYYIGDSPRSLDLRDLDGNGTLDVIVANGFHQNVVTMMGAGNGTFSNSRSFAFGDTPGTFSAVADFNGDGRADLAVAGASGGTDPLMLFIGNGDGTFLAAVTRYTSGLVIYSTTAADLNADGQTDLLLIDNGNLVTMIGNGNGTFNAPNQFSGVNPYQVAVGDVNGDGIVDAVTADPVTDSANVFIGNGNGTFKASVTLSGGDGAWRVSLRDLNGDGSLDIVTASANDNRANVITGNGNGTFSAIVSYATGTFPSGLNIADMNNDGALDIVTSNGPGTQILLGNAVTTAALGGFNLRTQSSALEALDTIREALNNVTSSLGKMGSGESRLLVAAQILEQRREDYIKAASQILDVDVATQSAELTRASILQQAAQGVLAQANLLPRLVLDLIAAA